MCNSFCENVRTRSTVIADGAVAVVKVFDLRLVDLSERANGKFSVRQLAVLRVSDALSE